MILYVIPYFISLGLSLSVAVVVWQRRSVPGALAYAVYAIGVAIWILGYILELASLTIELKGFWDDFQWLGSIIISITFPLFAIRFTQTSITSNTRKVKRNWILFSIIPGIFFLLLLTNGIHGLIRGESWLVEASPFPMLMYEYSTVVWAFAFYMYAVFIMSIVVLLRHFFDALPIYRTQIGLIIIGVIIPLIGSFISMAGISLTGQRDISPITFAIGNLFVAWGLWRYNTFDLVPIARNTVVETMGELVVVLDPSGRVIDINPATVALSQHPQRSPIGRHIKDVYPSFQNISEEAQNSQQEKFEISEGRFCFEVIVKPIYDHHNQLLARVIVAHDISTHKELESKLRKLNDELENRVHQRTQQLAEAYDTTLEGWAKALEIRDHETEGHSRRVTEMTVRLAREMGVNGNAIDHIRRGALLHDIGKMGVPDQVLHKPGRLTEEEFEIVKKHPGIARDLLASISFLEPAMIIPYYHHEWWNGHGYPQGLKENEIPIEARIFAVIDHWDALNSNRPYRQAWPQGKVISYLKENAGKIFDPQVVEAFLDLIDRGECCS